MKKRRGGLLQRMMAVLLSAVLVAGMVSNAAPASVLAQENAGSPEEGEARGGGEEAGVTEEGTASGGKSHDSENGGLESDGNQAEGSESESGGGETEGGEQEGESRESGSVSGNDAEMMQLTAIEEDMIMTAADDGTAAPGNITSNQTWTTQTLAAGTYTISSGVTVTLNGNLTVDGAVTIQGGGKLVRGDAAACFTVTGSESHLTLQNIEVDGASLSSSYPLISASGGAQVTLGDGCRIHHCIKSSSNGAVLNLNSASTAFKNAVIENCQATSYGGAVYMDNGSSLTIQSGIYRNNSTTDSSGSYGGGFVYNKKSALRIYNGSFINNTSYGRGGCIYNTGIENTETYLYGGYFQGNMSSYTGGTSNRGKGSGALYYSSENTADTVISISGSVHFCGNGEDGSGVDGVFLDISGTTIRKAKISSELQYVLPLYLKAEEGRVIAEGVDGYQLQKKDMKKISFFDIGSSGQVWYAKLDEANNQVVLTATNPNYSLYVTYGANGGEGNVSDSREYTSGDTVTVQPGTALHRDGYTFNGWNTRPDGTGTSYPAGGSFQITEETTLYAQWKESSPLHSHDGITFTPWESADSLPTDAGNYYLAKDIVLTQAADSCAWEAPSGTTNLCLNGHKVTYSDSDAVSAIKTGSGATLNIRDCNGSNGTHILTSPATGENVTIQGGLITGSGQKDVVGSGIRIYEGGTCNLYGGSIAGFSDTPGSNASHGAVRVEGTFHMYGGAITHNRSGCGGGVNICGVNAHFYLHNGSISYNYADFDDGGGICINDTGSFEMTGGEIRGNKAKSGGGGIHWYNDGGIGNTVHLSGGGITENSTGGEAGGATQFDKNPWQQFFVSGSIKITGNKNKDGKESNIYLNNGYTIGVDSSGLGSEAMIGVTTESAPTEQSPIAVTGRNKGDYSEYFQSDNPAYEIRNDSDTVKLILSHQHIASGTGWTLDKDGKLTITSDEGMADWINNTENGGETHKDDVKNVEIQDGVTSIGNNAFSHCSSLTSIMIPAGVTSIGDNAFSYCSSLTKVTMERGTPPTLGADVFSGCKFVTDKAKGIHVPTGKAETYKNASTEGWSTWKEYIAPDTQTGITNFAQFKEAVSKGGTVTITQDIILTETVIIDKDVTIVSDGNHTIKRGETCKDSMLTVSAGTLTLGGGSGILTLDGGAVWSGETDAVLGRGRLNNGINAQSSIIHGNRAGSAIVLKGNTVLQNNCCIKEGFGGAVTLHGSSLVIDGAKICGNKSYDGGGAVKTFMGSSVVMTGGEICQNEAGTHGGAFQIYGKNGSSYGEKVSCKIINGNIHNNLADGVGGGIAISNYSAVELSGDVIISGNKTTDKSGRGGGVGFIDLDTSLTVSGNVQIQGNLCGNDLNNLAVGGNENNIITIKSDSPLSGSAKISITTINKPTKEKPINITGANSTDYSKYFTSDNNEYVIADSADHTVRLTVKAPAHTHSPTRVDAKDATCMEDGNKAYYVCGCGKWFSDESGIQEITDKGSVVIAASGHSYDNSAWGYQGTDGHAHKCSKCNKHDTVSAHTAGAEATETAAQTCTVCGYIITPALGHTCNPQSVAKTEPNCTTAGKQAYYHCDGCGKNYEDEKGIKPIGNIDEWGNIAALGHDWGAWTQTKPATSTESGKKERTCSRCGNKETEIIPATGGGGNTGDNDNTGDNNNSGNHDNSGNKDNNGGSYNKASYDPATAPVRVTSENQGNIVKEVTIKAEDTFNAAIAQAVSELADIVLTKEEKELAEDGANIKIVLDIEDAQNTVSAADKAVVESALNTDAAQGFTVGQYLDVNLFKIINDNRSAIRETNKKILVTIAVPDRLKNTDMNRARAFAVVRVHNGMAEVLTDLDDSDDTITIATDRFSTYAIVYNDTADSGVTPGDDGVSNSQKDNEPKTGDNMHVELYATLSMVAGFAYLLLYFADRERGMTEERKKELVARLVGWAKQGGRIRKYFALAAIFVLLVYYHSIGKKTSAEWKVIYGE